MRVKDGEKYILPELFMDVAKEARLYTELTFQMLTKTFEYMKDKNISFSININYDNITNKRIFNKIIEELDNYPFPQNVVFEFVEIEKVDNIDYLKYFIEKIHKRDAKIAIDNFGGGYNNFVFLEQLDVDIIKISGDIVSRMLSSGNALFMVRNIVEFCKKNNIVSIAEYVSHRDIFMNLKNIGVDEYQGFYFCKPKENIE
jgi:EAL domain-containing protein (putative c-di-GMP-specific phosphodiesterase class I)